MISNSYEFESEISSTLPSEFTIPIQNVRLPQLVVGAVIAIEYSAMKEECVT